MQKGNVCGTFKAQSWSHLALVCFFNSIPGGGNSKRGDGYK